jgi:hypothetical protein
MPVSRRGLIIGGGTMVLLEQAGGPVWIEAAAAAAQKAPLRVLTAREADWLSGLGAAIAPPARAAGLVHYVDHHLAVPPAESLLALRYLDIAPPYADFYRPGLASLAAMTGNGAPPPDGDPRWGDILARLGAGKIDGWTGPPPPLFLFAVRLDAIDIAWGTMAGFERLDVPYLAHIEPEGEW